MRRVSVRDTFGCVGKMERKEGSGWAELRAGVRFLVVLLRGYSKGSSGSIG